MADIHVRTAGLNIRVTIGAITIPATVVLTAAEAEQLREELRKAIASAPTEDHLRRVGAL